MEFYGVLDSLPSWWRSFFVTLTLTGLRVEELRGLQPLSIRAQNEVPCEPK
jgi:hypothetical protein